MLAGEERFALTVGYTDRFGALGKISVLTGRVLNSHVEIDTWVLSCRAFARRIEYQCLRTLFRFFDTDAVVLHYAQTQRNGPTGSFLTSLLDAVPDGSVRISRSDFESKCPNLFHKVNVQDEARKSPAAAGARGSHE
jgi:predicted enzyme involved in methoxymalonyl-ACP biosynthesis